MRFKILLVLRISGSRLLSGSAHGWSPLNTHVHQNGKKLKNVCRKNPLCSLVPTASIRSGIRCILFDNIIRKNHMAHVISVGLHVGRELKLRSVPLLRLKLELLTGLARPLFRELFGCLRLPFHFLHFGYSPRWHLLRLRVIRHRRQQ